MFKTAIEIVRDAVGKDWVRMTPLAQNLKGKPAFRMDYSEVIRSFVKAEREGIVEIKVERRSRNGPGTKFVRARR